jgi:hypothetical protein
VTRARATDNALDRGPGLRAELRRALRLAWRRRGSAEIFIAALHRIATVSSMTLKATRAHRAPHLILALTSVTSLAMSCSSSRSTATPSRTTSEAPRAAARHARFTGAVNALADKLEASYVLREVGARYAARLRANLAQGTYDAIDDRETIAGRLASDLQAVAPDGHLRVVTDAGLTPDGHLRARPSGNPAAPAGGADPRTAPGDPAGPRVLRGPGRSGGPGRPPAIGDTAWLADGVAYIQFNEFPGDPATVAAVDRFMADHASAKAIIIDARSHHGGGSAEMDVMLPYLYAKETPLVDMEVAASIDHARGEGSGPPRGSPSNMRTVPAPPGLVRHEQVVTPHPIEHRLFAAQVFYLTSARTFSAAEHLAFAFKRTGRAVLIGERTGGGNHFGGWESLGDGLAVFLPIGRTLDPVTGADWEGVGVAPDVAVPAVQALDEAVRRATHR